MNKDKYFKCIKDNPSQFPLEVETSLVDKNYLGSVGSIVNSNGKCVMMAVKKMSSLVGPTLKNIYFKNWITATIN